MDYVLHDLSIGYGGRPLLPPLSATLGEGELCALLGANGAGKSTLLRTMAGFLPRLSGELLLDGTDTSRLTPSQLSRRVGVVLTERVSALGLTVRGLVSLGRSPYTGYFGRMQEEDLRAVEAALGMVGITGLASRETSTLSDGERQKAMIAKALAQQTPVILLDEPTAFLDFPSKVELMLLLRRLCREMRKSVLLSTHDLDLALQVCDKVWLIDGDGTLHSGSPQELSRTGQLDQAFSSPHARFDPQSLRFSIV